MDKQTEKLLKDKGWAVICESPFEICNVDGSLATMQAADYVVAGVIEEATEEQFNDFQEFHEAIENEYNN